MKLFGSVLYKYIGSVKTNVFSIRRSELTEALLGDTLANRKQPCELLCACALIHNWNRRTFPGVLRGAQSNHDISTITRYFFTPGQPANRGYGVPLIAVNGVQSRKSATSVSEHA